MNRLSYYNPLKRYDTKEHIEFLNTILQHYNSACFIGDELGYFFSPFRNVNNLSLVFKKTITFNFFTLLKQNPIILKQQLKMYHSLLNYNLIEYFEKQMYVEKNPVVGAFMLMCLTNLSDNFDFNLSNYSEKNIPLVEDAINKIDSYYMGDAKIYKTKIPDSGLIISYKQDFNDREGILITDCKKDYNLINEIGDLKYYFVEEK